MHGMSVRKQESFESFESEAYVDYITQINSLFSSIGEPYSIEELRFVLEDLWKSIPNDKSLHEGESENLLSMISQNEFNRFLALINDSPKNKPSHFSIQEKVSSAVCLTDDHKSELLEKLL